MLSEAVLVALVRRFQLQLATVSARTALAVTAAWDALDSYDEADVERFAARAAPAERAGKATAVALAAGFYSLMASVRPAPIPPTAIPVAIDPREPFIAYWRSLKAGKPWEDALLSGRGRAEAVADNLVISSARRTGDAVAEANGLQLQGWRRVLTGSSCAWCATVATQRYRTAESADFGHARCDCTAVPIFSNTDPGRVINRPVLDTLKKRGTAYWKSGYVDADGNPAARPDAASPAPTRGANPDTGGTTE